MWNEASTEALLLSLKVSLVSTLAIMLVGTLMAFWMVRRRGPLPRVAESLLSLPLVVPPVVIGYCLLVVLSPTGPIGRWLDKLGVAITFNWKGAVIAATVMALPLYLVIAKVAFQKCDKELAQAARTLNAGPVRVFFTITLPIAMPGLLAASAVAFARAFGEFGATIMLAGNIPGQTQTVSQAIYTDLMAGKEQAAWGLVAVSVAVGIAAMVVSQLLTGQGPVAAIRRQASA